MQQIILTNMLQSNYTYIDSDLIQIGNNLLMTDQRSTRNFEQLISERGDLISSQGTSFYNNIFENIKDKLFTLNESEVTLTSSKIDEYSQKHNSKIISESICEFKKNISTLYEKKIKLTAEIEAARENYTSFCEHVNSFLYKIEESELLKEHLNLEIEKYYIKLKLPDLVDEYSDINTEFEFLKKMLIEISGMCPPTICTVCMDKQVTWFIDPCGHTICSDCKIKCERQSDCHICRMKKKNYKRLYL